MAARTAASGGARGFQHARTCSGGKNLDAAIVQAERWWRAERKAFQLASAFGRGNRLSLDVLAELRLILRLMRWKRMRGQFAAILAALYDDPIRTAAE